MKVFTKITITILTINIYFMNDQAKLKSATKNVGTLELDPNILTYYIRGVRKEELLLKRLLRYLLCDSHPHVWIWVVQSLWLGSSCC